MVDPISESSEDVLPTQEELESESIALAMRLVSEFKSWAGQDRAVYTSEVMERELDDLFPVDSFLEKKRQQITDTPEE